ncbi:MAG: energy transducer TonB, partial [Pseudophaeobacter sp.]
MIRRSAAIGTLAFLLSLLLHFLGLNFTFEVKPEPTGGGVPEEVIAVGNAFEDIAEDQSEPVPPEPAPAPEPETQPTPE